MSPNSIPSWRLFEPWWRLIPHNTRCNRRQQLEEKADPPRCEGTGLLKGKPVSMNGGEYRQNDCRNVQAHLHWLEKLIQKEISYCPEQRNPRSSVIGGNTALWHFKGPYHYVPGSLSVPVGSSSFLFFHFLPVRGKSNPIADSLSRFQFQCFRRLASHADSIPTQIPQQLLSDLDLCCQINATFTLLRVLPLLVGKFMPLPRATIW